MKKNNKKNLLAINQYHIIQWTSINQLSGGYYKFIWTS